MNATLTVVVGSLGGILAGLAALMTAIISLRRSKETKKLESDTSESTINAVESLFENQTIINKMVLDRLNALEEKLKD